MITEIQDIPIMYVESSTGPQGAKQAFEQLKLSLKSLADRTIYATYQPKTNTYRACVKIDATDRPSQLGFETGVIRGGKYVQEQMEEWEDKEDEIVIKFHHLRSKNKYDATRPNIEYYHSSSKLILMMPVKD